MDAARRMRASARKKTVRSQCDSQISEAARNIAYLQGSLEKLSVEASQNKPAEENKHKNSTNAKFTRLDLFRWDRPATMGPRIKLMLQQLEYKTSIEQQYEKGTRKMIELYKQTGDRRSQAEAYANLGESTSKMALLKRSKKRYSDMNLATILGGDDDDADSGFAAPNVRRPLTGVLSIFVQQVEEVDHTIAWADQVEMWVTLKVENNSTAAARTRTKFSSMFEENFSIPVDKGNEVEFTVYDRSVSASQSQPANPVALLWLKISDIAEAIRQKRVERKLKQSGWASAARVQELNAATGFESLAMTGSPTGPASSSTGPPTGPSDAPAESQDDTVEGWFTLEPAGRVYLRLGFEKTGTHKRARLFEGNNDLANLGRKNAVRKREETQQVHGHEFVLHQAYNIVRCSICGDFTTSYFQCQECLLTCDRKCFSKVVTKCGALMSQDPDEELNHRIPHRFEPTTNMKAAWCAQCGFILPLASKRNVRKCSECGIITHTNCKKFVPDLCGMTMEMAAQVVNEITSTRIRLATKALADSMTSSSSTAAKANKTTPSQSHSPQYHTHGSHAHFSPVPGSAKPEKLKNAALPNLPSQQAYGGTSLQQHSTFAPPPKAAPVRRKQVPTSGAGFVPSLSIDPASQKPDSTLGTPISTPTGYSSPGKYPPQASSANKLQEYTQPALRSPVQSEASRTSQVSQPESASGSSSQPNSQGASQNSAPTKPANAGLTTPLKNSTSAEIPGFATAGTAAATEAARILTGHSTANQNMANQASQSAKLLPRRRRKIGLDDFTFLAVLGKGNFGKVMLAESKHTGQLYAVKVLKKNFIIDNREVESTRSEKRVFLIANRERHPFLINLFACFQTENRIYFVMDYVSGGDLMFHIQQKMFSAKRAQFYAAEVLLALKHFHDNNVIYRDLKLDNILLSLDGHIKVADYGLCKENMGHGQTTGTFCGTPDFIAPEILLDQKYGRSVDWWALGVLMYQMLLGKSPFHGNDEDEVYDAILSDEPLYPIHMPRDSVSILQQLLTRDPAKRLGSGTSDAEEIMSHPYFGDVDFEAMLNLRVDAPYKPELDSPTDVKYFEQDFTSEMPALTPMNSTLTSEMQEEFRGFSYNLSDSI